MANPRTPLAHYPARRIALIKPSALGDIIHSLPVLTAIRRRYPEASITWVVNRSYEPLLHGHPHLSDTLAFDRASTRSGLPAVLKTYNRFLQLLRQRRFDLVIDLQGLLRSGVMTGATGAPRRVGLHTSREGATWFYTDVIHVPNAQSIHAVDRYWQAAEALGVGDTPKTFHVPVPSAEREWVSRALRDCPRPWLAIGPGSRWETKRWPPDHFAELARRAQVDFGVTIILIGSRDERHLSEQVARQLPRFACDFTGQTSLPRLAALLAMSDLMLANDTGPLHLAAALGRPVLAPYTCTRVSLNGPYGELGRAIETNVWCHGSYLKRCARLDCMRELTPDRLWPLLKGMLEQWQASRRSA
jgi:lipopolysaccharide heptosyltransferase I